MRILTGGPGSTGSSLLKNILSRHTRIFSGSETSLFCKKELYIDFERFKHRIPHRFPLGLRSHSFHMYNGVDLLHHEYGHDDAGIKQLIHGNHDFQSFADAFFEKSMLKYQKDIWLEKTPDNAYLFEPFLSSFNTGKVIHVTRDPYDNIASLLKRGMDIIYATGICLLNNAAALSGVNEREYHRVRYEDLTTEPYKTITSICHFLGIDFQAGMLEPGNIYGIKDTNIKSWAHGEMDEVTLFPKSTFESLTGEEKELIFSAIHSIEVSAAGKVMFDIEICSFPELMDKLGYEIKPSSTPKLRGSTIRRKMVVEKWRRILRLYSTGWSFPLTVKS